MGSQQKGFGLPMKFFDVGYLVNYLNEEIKTIQKSSRYCHFEIRPKVLIY